MSPRKKQTPPNFLDTPSLKTKVSFKKEFLLGGFSLLVGVSLLFLLVNFGKEKSGGLNLLKTEVGGTPSVNAYFSPEKLEVPDGEAFLFWSATNADNVWANCSMGGQVIYNDWAGVSSPSGGYGPFKFSLDQAGQTLSCLMTAFNGTTQGQSTQVSLSLYSPDVKPSCSLNFSKDWVDYGENLSLSIQVQNASLVKDAKLVCSFFDPSEGSVVEGVNRDNGQVRVDFLSHIQGATSNNSASLSYNYQYGGQVNKNIDGCELYLNLQDYDPRTDFLRWLENKDIDNFYSGIRCLDSVYIGPQCGSYENAYDVGGDNGCPVEGMSNWRDPISCGQLKAKPVSELCEHATKFSAGDSCVGVLSFHTCNPSYVHAWWCEDGDGHRSRQCTTGYWDGSDNLDPKVSPTPKTTPSASVSPKATITPTTTPKTSTTPTSTPTVSKTPTYSTTPTSKVTVIPTVEYEYSYTSKVAPASGTATNVALLLSVSAVVTLGVWLVMKKIKG